jgi:septal ring factor EnvC (AmiA/AmiB activator)
VAAARTDAAAQTAAAQTAAAQTAAAQATAARAAAARVALARQHAVREEQRTRLRWLAAAILEHEHAIALLHTELERRQDQLRAANQEVAALTSELAHSATGSDERCDSVPPPDGASLPFVSEK